MVRVKSVKIDGEMIHVFRSMIYIFESHSRFTLELDLIVSEIVVKKYKNEETLIVEMELEDGRLFSSIMNVTILPGRLPRLNLFMEIDDPDEYQGIQRVNENANLFPNLEEDITIEEIRQVEMPHEKITLKLNLPIDQIEWLKEQKPRNLNEIFSKLIYVYWGK